MFRNITPGFIWLAAVIILLWPQPVFAREPLDEIILGGTYTIENGEELDGNLVVIGGVANILAGARINGDIYIAAGNVNIDGAVDGSVFGLGGVLEISESAEVAGDIYAAGSVLNLHENAVVGGEVVIPELGEAPPMADQQEISVSRYYGAFGLRALGFLLRLLAFATVAVMVMLIAPKRVEIISQTIWLKPGLSGAVGTAGLFIGLIVFSVLIITIILSPLGILGILFVFLSVLTGWVSVGLEIGKRFGLMLGRRWAPGISAGIGTFVVTLLAYSVDFLLGGLPCVGWMLPVALAVLGFGGVILSRWGREVYGLSEIPN